MDKNKLKETYQNRKIKFQGVAEQLRQRYNKFALVRLVVFVVAVALFIYLLSNLWWSGILFTVVFLLAFAKFVKWHQAIKASEAHHRNLVLINENELKILNDSYVDFDNGEDFKNPLHPYTIDLDIFGDYSFYQYTNRTSTSIGRRRYANYLKNGNETNLNSIKERQNAAKELADKLDWRQHFQAKGQTTEDDLKHIELLKKWLEEPNFIIQNNWLKISLWFIPIWMLVGTFLSIYLEIGWLFLLFLILPGLILKQTLSKVNDTHLFTTHAEKILSGYSRLIGHIEEYDFSSSKLKMLQAVFEKNASKDIERLSYIISQLNVRYNVFAIFLNIFGLWDLQWVKRLEDWKKNQKKALPKWFEALAEFEAVNCLGTMYYNHNRWVFPTIKENGLLEAKALGHPLIAAEKRICNAVHIPTQGHIKLVTGSNMAGKSTFLRTVGLNIVLAMIGAPVCAKEINLPLLKTYTSMRTQDALHESTSSFYAELKRLKTIIEAVEQGENIFFLLDEILKGTNSNDRHTGSKALIKQLIKSKGTGIIATHDLELGSLEAHANGTIENLCMEVEVRNDELIFDYKIKKGVSQSFNATHLMRNMGIKIEM